MQLHSKSGFIFYNNFNSGIYYSTSRYERLSSTILSQYRSWQRVIYLIKYFTALSLAEIGQLFEMDYSAVSQAAKRFEQESKTNHKIGEIKQKMMAALRENSM
jgi:chromosomal replication initiation ATPase DnaA